MEYIRKEIEIREASIILANPKNNNVNDNFFRNKTDKYNQNYSHKNTKKYEYSPPKASAAVLTTQVEENSPIYPNKQFYNNRSRFNQNQNKSAFERNFGIQNCVFCSSKSHMSHDCAMNVIDKRKALMTRGLCFICFQGHLRKFCPRKELKCKQCNSNAHNSLICNVNQNEALVSSERDKVSAENSLTLFCKEKREIKRSAPDSSVLLQTFNAAVKMNDENELFENNKNKTRIIRCLMDNGSTRTFCLRKLCDLLGLKIIDKEELTIYSFGGNHREKQIYDIVELVLHNINDFNRKIKIKAVVIDQITLGHVEIPSPWIRNIALERSIKLADQGTSKDIEILIGSDYISEILGETVLRISRRLLATDTTFGFVIQGIDENINNSKEVQVNHLTVENNEWDFERVKTLWDLEAIGINSEKEISRSDAEILESFRENTTYENKRYETRLLWIRDNKELFNNYEIAKRRLFNLINTFERDKEFYVRYSEIIKEHLESGIVESTKSELRGDGSTGYYMPHHAVVRENKESTKVRIVFDASSKCKDKLSLNDFLESGPNLNPDLLKIILRFRLHRIAFCADIQRAFLEVGISKEDREYLKFLWINREGSNLHPPNIETLRYARVPFGVKCSPFLLTATIRLHLEKYEKLYTKSCELLKNLYVDDLIAGTHDVNSALELSKNTIFILGEASMNLRRWVSNSPELHELWKKSNVDYREIVEEDGIALKVLGLVWDHISDTLKLDTTSFEKLKGKNTITKRIILAASGMLFDPIGIMNPFMIKIKIMLQALWKNDLQWDERVPNDIEAAFLEWLDDVKTLKNFEIPRLYITEIFWDNIELHIFSDASPKCYGSVAYFKAKHSNGYGTCFIMSKSRLAPLKGMTLPRLELMGTLLSARLGSYLLCTFPKLNPKNVFYWTDSQICIYWIKGIAENLKQFVKNRVLEIKEKTDPTNWYFCNGKLNPADKLTRGIRASTLINDDTWKLGPKWLADLDIIRDVTATKFVPESKEVEEERKREFVYHVNSKSITPIFDLHKYSDLNKVLRITAYVFRFINNLKQHNPKCHDVLTASELSTAEIYWLRVTQQIDFNKEYCQLTANKPISSDSKLFGLNPILNPDGVIALKGRLQNSELDIQSKHPVILPSKSRLTELIVMNEHKNVLHSGVSDTLTQIREKYWIIRGRQTVKSCLNKCLVCKRFKAKQGRQVVAPLPAHRINEAQAFEITAVDFAGPLYTRNNDKSYIALFTCAVTRAVHLEVVSSLSTEHFLLAFRRFISRRGVCRMLNSDNALTFKGADSELKKLYMHLNNSELQNYFGKKGITWQYIVERAAWWGGYWERMVRMTKIILRKILGRAFVNFEELQTILTEIESILNSRPLTYLYSEPNEPSPLTPAHFLIGKRIAALPPHIGKFANNETKNSRKILLKRYLYRERLLNNFWHKWRREYLLQLKSVNFMKHVNVNSDFHVGDVVLIGEEKTPRQLWKLGRVCEVHMGRDKRVRAVTLKTASGHIKRPIQLIYNLELGKDSI